MNKIFFAEFLGTAALLMIVIGSGIMGESLSAGNSAVALLANAIATGAGLFVLISALGPISGAHFNPIVSLYAWRVGNITLTGSAMRMLAQFLGAPIGVIITNLMFDRAAISISSKVRASSGLWLSEVIASVGLLACIHLLRRASLAHIAAVVASYITAAYWFTASTSFANPAVTIARTLSDSFAGIRPADTTAFITMQLLALAVFLVALRVLQDKPSAPAE
jgi:glycerol uptake facilitator-like aquaporin